MNHQSSHNLIHQKNAGTKSQQFDALPQADPSGQSKAVIFPAVPSRFRIGTISTSHILMLQQPPKKLKKKNM